MYQRSQENSASITAESKIESLSSDDPPKRFARVSVIVDQHIARVKKICISIFMVAAVAFMIPDISSHDPVERVFILLILIASGIFAYRKFQSYKQKLKKNLSSKWTERLGQENSEADRQNLQDEFIKFLRDFESSILQ